MTQDGQQVNDALVQIAAKLGVAVEHLWGVLVRQAYVEFVQSLVLVAIVASVGYAAFRLQPRVAKWVKDGGSYSDRDTAVSMVSIFGGLAFVLVAVLATINLVAAIGYAMNPEYFALQQVLDAARR